MKLNYKHTFFIGLGFISISAFWQLYDNIVPLILQNTFLISETMAGSIMAGIVIMCLSYAFGFLLENISYRTLFPYSVVFSIFSLITMSFVKHGDSKPPKKSPLENFDLDD